jgi:UDPglucose--hexose-1-phosphate uridylyltransferase
VAIEFRRALKETRFLDPASGFAESRRVSEIRRDPLTGRASRVLQIPARLPSKPDLAALVEKSLRFGCPFCPDKALSATPEFPPDIVPEPRIRVGDATLVCNMFPYDTYSAVCIVSGQHFVAIDGFTEQMLVDAFSACQTYLRIVMERDVEARYASINWNYMPLAGGSLVHPHIQTTVGDQPTNYHHDLLENSQRYFCDNGSVYWADLVAAERELGERYLAAIGPVHWLTAFSPRGLMDFTAVFADRVSVVDITPEEWRCFAAGVVRVARYLGDLNFHSFNLSLFSGVRGDGSTWTSARVIPRFLMVEAVGASDINYFETMHEEPFTRVKPEDTCRDLRPYFAGEGEEER